MVQHIFKYRVKTMLGNKMSLFWMSFFPIILSLLFFFAFSGLQDVKLERYPVAVVDIDAAMISSMESSELFKIKAVDSMEEADKLLKDGEVSGIISKDDTQTYLLTVTNTGLKSSIAKFFMDSYISINACISDAYSKDMVTLEQLASLDLSKSYTEQSNVNDNLDTNVVYFYSLIGMTAIMGGTLAIGDVAMYQANQSHYAARIVSAPIKKSKAFSVSIMASVFFHFMTLLITLAFLIFILGIDFGSRLPEIILLCFVACFTGMMLGAFVCSLIKKKEGVKIAVILSYTLFGSFLSGMMSLDIKYIVSQSFPWLQYINPTNLVTDALYALYYYPDSQRYLLNLGLLLAFGIAAMIGTSIKLRRQQYASI